MNNNILKYILVIVIVSIAVYANSLTGEFISDDIQAIAENPHIYNTFSLWHLQHITNSFIFKLFKFNPIPYHVLSVLIHTLNACLVFAFLLLFFDALPSFFGALIFATHPINVEAVAWISGRAYILSTALLLSSFLLYNAATKKPTLNRENYLASLLLHLIGLFTGWYAILFPGVVLLYDFTYTRYKKTWKLWIPYIIIVIVWAIIKYSIIDERITMAKNVVDNIGAIKPLLSMSILFDYAKLIIWPQQLSFYRDLVITPIYLQIAKAIVLFAGLCMLPILFNKAKSLFFAITIFVLLLSPAYSPIPIASHFAERYAYFPCLSFSIVFAFIIQKFLSKIKIKKITTIFLIILVGAYSTRTILRNNDWNNEISFWKATIKSSTKNHQGYNNLGNAYHKIGKNKQAITAFKEALEINPMDEKAYNNLAISYHATGDYQQAVNSYHAALKINPDYAQAYYNLGYLYDTIGDKKQAATLYIRTLETNPDHIQAHNNLAAIFQADGNYKLAIALYKKALLIKQNHPTTHMNLATIYYDIKQYALAIKHYDKAVFFGFDPNPEFSELLDPFRKKNPR